MNIRTFLLLLTQPAVSQLRAKAGPPETQAAMAENSHPAIASTTPNDFINDGVGIGRDFITPLTGDYKLSFAFNGNLGPVTIDLK